MLFKDGFLVPFLCTQCEMYDKHFNLLFVTNFWGPFTKLVLF